MNSPYRVHPALPSKTDNMVQFSSVVRGSLPSKAAVAPNRLALLVKLEGDIRKLPGWQPTVFHALNETQELLGHASGFFFNANNRGRLFCESASAVSTVDTRAPYVAALNAAINRILEKRTPQAFDLVASLHSDHSPARHGLWLPMFDAKGLVFGGLLLLRPDVWTDEQKAIAVRMTEAYAFALRVHRPPQLLRRISAPRWLVMALPLAVLALALIPVPLSTLAPFEIEARNPAPVTAPLDGVIADILPEPNTNVRLGEVILRLDTTELGAAADVALKRVNIAEMRLSTARNGAFGDVEFKRNLATLEQELALAQSEYDLARGRLGRATLVADAAGVLIYSSRSDWLGRPVRVGEKIMEIADPTRVTARVDVGVHDAVALDSSSDVRLFFDADPLNPLSARIYDKSFHAIERNSGQLSYAVRAMVAHDGGKVPRIGLRGTAQLIGDHVPLGFFVLRRPIAALRQYWGV